MGAAISAQYAGQVAEPLLGGFIGGQIGMRAVFLGTSILLGLGATGNWFVLRLPPQKH